MSELKSQDKPFDISKWVVWEAYQRVKANKGAAGVDGQSIEDFEKDRDANLYKIWNRMSSGSYFPPPVRAVEIPKAGGQGVRVLGLPTVADRVAQTVVAMYLEPKVEPAFHPDSYGYRPKRSALDAVGRCRERCWSFDWVIDLDIQKFLRHGAVGPGTACRGTAHRPAVDLAVCPAVAASAAAPAGRHRDRTDHGYSARLGDFTIARQPVHARVPRTPERGWV